MGQETQLKVELAFLDGMHSNIELFLSPTISKVNDAFGGPLDGEKASYIDGERSILLHYRRNEEKTPSW